MIRRAKIKRKHKSRMISVYAVMASIIIVIVLVSTAYALWSSNLNINGNVDVNYVEPQLSFTPTQPSSGRYTTNTTFQTRWGIFGVAKVTIFTISGDSYENNIVTTNLVNNGTSLVTSTISVTFTITLQNTSDTTYTDGKVTTSEEDTSGYMTPTRQTLSSTTVASGGTTKLTAVITLQADASTPTGSYEDYKICFTVNGVPRYFHYKILVAQ